MTPSTRGKRLEPAEVKDDQPRLAVSVMSKSTTLE